MKTTTKNLEILFYIIGIIGILLISGCIGEKPEEKQAEIAELEKKQAELEKKQAELEKKQAELEKKQAELEKKQAELKDNLSELEEKQSALEEKAAKEINKTESEGNRSWCEETAAKKYGAGGKLVWIEGILEFKGKQMCHLKYFSVVADGTVQYDWYFTENEEEIYRVITYPDGRVEETEVV